MEHPSHAITPAITEEATAVKQPLLPIAERGWRAASIALLAAAALGGGAELAAGPAAPAALARQRPLVQKPPQSSHYQSLGLPRHIVDFANTASGYAIGNVTERDSIIISDLREKAAKGSYVLARILHKNRPSDDECGWVKVSELPVLRVRYKQDICKDQAARLADRDNIGKDFNCAEHACDDGSAETDVKPACGEKAVPLHLNYNQKKEAAYGKLALNITGFRYRYTTLDGDSAIGRAIVRLPDARHTKSLWVALPTSCVAGKRHAGPELNPLVG